MPHQFFSMAFEYKPLYSKSPERMNVCHMSFIKPPRRKCNFSTNEIVDII
uniref:Uncharacterized protein n=1 Tax=Anguilla anguilla TaxID=7936 RepID=A0A0E9TK01_ANGAN